MGLRGSVKIASQLTARPGGHNPLVTVVKNGSGYGVQAFGPTDAPDLRQTWVMDTGEFVLTGSLITYFTFTMTLDRKRLALTRGATHSPVTLKPYTGDKNQHWYTVAALDLSATSLGDRDGDFPCLDLKDSKTADHTPVVSSPSKGLKAPNQSWRLQWVETLPGGNEPQQYQITKALLDSATKNQWLRASLLTDPASVFADAGYPIQPGERHAFNEFFKSREKLTAALVGRTPLESVDDLGCVVCQIAAWSIAAALVAAGAAAMALLTPETAVVVALAAFAGVSTRVALAFVASLAVVSDFSVTEVLSRICAWTRLC